MRPFCIPLLLVLYLGCEASQQKSLHLHPHLVDEKEKPETETRREVKASGEEESTESSLPGNVVMNIFGGNPPSEAEEPKEKSEEVNKIASTVGRLEAEEDASEKHDADLENMAARHAEAQANAETSKLVARLEDETKEVQQKENQDEDGFAGEEASADSAIRAIEVEEEADESQAKAKEADLRSEARALEKDMVNEEQLIKEDEDQIKADKIETEEKLAEIAGDEAAKLEDIEEVTTAVKNVQPERTEEPKECTNTPKEKKEANGEGQEAALSEKSPPSEPTSASTPETPLKASQLSLKRRKQVPKETKPGNCLPLSAAKRKPDEVGRCSGKACAELPSPEGYPPAFRQREPTEKKSPKVHHHTKKERHKKHKHHHHHHHKTPKVSLHTTF